MRVLVVTTFAFCAIIFTACGGSGSTAPTKRDVPKAELYSVEQLSANAERNEVRFEENTKGRTIGIVGKIELISADAFGTKLVHLRSTDGSLAKEAICKFQDHVTVSHLNKGDTVKLVGTGRGLWVGTMQFDECVFWEGDQEQGEQKPAPKK